MSKILWISVSVAVVGLGTLIAVNQFTKSQQPLIGVKHDNQGQSHIQQGEKHVDYNSEPASSGPHYADNSSPTQWGVYITEIPPETYIHNEEHGGVIITYQPDLLPVGQLKKLRALFAPPFSNKNFSPKKAIVMPRIKNTHAIQIGSWEYTLNLDSYDETTIIKYFTDHAGRAPEGLAGPTNTPINQAAQ